jgi:hypothetical protein
MRWGISSHDAIPTEVDEPRRAEPSLPLERTHARPSVVTAWAEPSRAPGRMLTASCSLFPFHTHRLGPEPAMRHEDGARTATPVGRAA